LGRPYRKVRKRDQDEREGNAKREKAKSERGKKEKSKRGYLDHLFALSVIQMERGDLNHLFALSKEVIQITFFALCLSFNLS
jgi:hypothetical protein